MPTITPTSPFLSGLLSGLLTLGVAAIALPQAGFAQGVPAGTNPETGARPGNVIGTGMSLPMSNNASNIDQSDTTSTIAPNLPSPQLGPNASPVDYLRAARGALAAGRTGEAQQAMEMAETRLLDRSTPLFQTNSPDANPLISQIGEARRALGNGDRARSMQLLEQAISTAH